MRRGAGEAPRLDGGLEPLPDPLVGDLVVEEDLLGFYHGAELAGAAVGGHLLQLNELLVV